MNEMGLRLAIIGCGAITEHGHLPAAVKTVGISELHLVEKDVARAQRLAARFHVTSVCEDYRSLFEKIDAAIVALPPALHASVSSDLLAQGIHVLVEKPMARSLNECDAMLQAASRSGAKLAVGYVRRFRWAYRWARSVIQRGVLGTLESVDVSEGGVFDWPIASPFFLDRQAAGGGVLIDAGVHVFDALHWLLGPVEVSSYRDDDMGGVEADCEIDLLLGDAVRAHVELSRTRAMRNTTIVRGSNGSLEIHAFHNQVSLQLRDDIAGDRPPVATTQVCADSLDLHGQLKRTHQSDENLFGDQLRDFVEAITQNRPPAVTGEQGRMATTIVEQCYARRQPLHHPWVFAGIPGSLRQDVPADETEMRIVAAAGGAR